MRKITKSSKMTKICLLFVCGIILFTIGKKAFWFIYYQTCFTLNPPRSSSIPPLALREEVDLCIELRKAGLKRDRTKLPLIRKVLKEEWHPTILTAALMAAGRLADEESIPAIQSIIQRYQETNVGELAEVIIALIQTEKWVEEANSPQALIRKIKTFLKIVKMSKERIEEAARAFRRAKWRSYTPSEIYAFRLIAELVAEAIKAGVPNAANIAGLDFSLDYAAQLKVRLASMSKRERISWLIETIARKRVIRGQDYYLVCALADEGIEAVEPILAKLKFLKHNREGYAYPGIKTLFRTLACIGDKRAIPVIRSFVGDKEIWLDYYARQALEYLESGRRFALAVQDY